MNQFWWCCYEVSLEVKDEDFVEKWPVPMQGWCSGTSETHSNWVALVWAPDCHEAWNVILSCCPKKTESVSQRTEPRPLGETHVGSDRFPISREDVEALKS